MERALSIVTIALLLAVSAFAQKQQTDRAADAFKGPVKSVLRERAELDLKSGKPEEAGRRPESTSTFDVNGNRVEEKFYDGNGNLLSAGRYSFLNADRIYNEIPVENRSELIAEIDPPRGKPRRKSDERYMYRFKYKYDGEGNRREEITYQNDGSLWQRRIVKVTGNQKEELVYAEDGSLNQKYVYTLDEKGNELEMLIYDPTNNLPQTKESYKYLEIDATGNWLKRIASVEVKSDGQPSMKTSYVTYRTISYF